MKIGIITCDQWLKLWDNYGTLLQNYALQTFLRRAGHEPFLIRTAGSGASVFSRERAARIFKQACRNPKSFFPKLKNAIGSRVCGRRERARIAKFNAEHPRFFASFFEKYIPKTERCFSAEALSDAPPEADAYIVGSDQVWGAVSSTTFLGFGNPAAVRIAYAASTAWATRPREWFSAAEKMLPRFDAVSVREPEGVGACAKAGRHDARHVCDPTLLLEKDDYLKIVRAENADEPFPQKTVLAYFLNVKKRGELPWDEVVAFARERRAALKVVPLQGAEFAIPDEFVFTPSPAQWLNAYDKAECVLTNSFHGTAFAILMRKPFLVVLQKGKTSAENCRFLSVLEKLGLTSRILKNGIGGGVSPRKWTRRSIGKKSEKSLRRSVRNRRVSLPPRCRVPAKFRSVFARERRAFRSRFSYSRKLVKPSRLTGFFAF